MRFLKNKKSRAKVIQGITLLSIVALGMGYLGLAIAKEALMEEKREDEHLDEMYGEGFAKSHKNK